MTLMTTPIWAVCSACPYMSTNLTEALIHALKEDHILDLEFER